jgi:mycothiol synthase
MSERRPGVTMTVGALGRGRLDEARALLARSCPFDDAAAVAEEKLFGGWPGEHPGGTLGAFVDGNRLVGVAAWAGRWLRLIAVDPDETGHGVGKALLDAVAAAARAGGATRLRTGDQAGNYLAPGIDTRNRAAIDWFWRKGFVEVARYDNIRVPLPGNPLVTAARAAELAEGCAARGYEVRRAGPGDTTRLLETARDAFAAAWAWECARALAFDPPGVHIAVERATGEIAAFAAHDGNNQGLGWFGPAGTLQAHRGKGLGAALLLPCLLDVAAAGHEQGVIAWIGPREFYEKVAGAVADRSFVVLQKDAL